MEEQHQGGARENLAVPGGLGSPFSSVPENQLATVASGPYAEQLPVANATVGQIRLRLGPRFDIDPRSQAILDGREVGDREVVRAGQLLTFTYRAGEKGGVARVAAVPELKEPQVVITGERARTCTPEGEERTMLLSSLLERVMPRAMTTGEMVLPDGVKALLSQGRQLLCVHQTPPRVYNLKWIRPDSEEPFGIGANYRTVRVSLPYLVMMEPFGPTPNGRLTLLNQAECFFRREPLSTLDDELLFPALLNCSKFNPPEGKPLAWLCTQYLDRSFDQEPREGARLWKAHRALLQCLVGTGFNLSSEHHEGNSWFSASRHLDPRINTIETWEEASQKDPLFVLDVPWLATGLSVRGMAERMFQLHGNGRKSRLDSANLVHVILNQP